MGVGGASKWDKDGAKEEVDMEAGPHESDDLREE